MVQPSNKGAELRKNQQGRARSTVTRKVREISAVVKFRDEVDPVARDWESPVLVCLPNGIPEFDRGRRPRQPWRDRRLDVREMTLDILRGGVWRQSVPRFYLPGRLAGFLDLEPGRCRNVGRQRSCLEGCRGRR